MISTLTPLAAGNAVRIIIQPPAGANCWRVLRNSVDAFAGPSDPAATVVDALSTEKNFLDLTGLTNGTTYWYHDYTSADGGASWMDSGVSVSTVPNAHYADTSPDPQELVRSRVEAGLAVEIARGSLSPASGLIPVTTAPFALADGVTFPTVSVHMDTSASGERGIGEDVDAFMRDLSGDWQETIGWLARVRLQIAAVSLNSDERLELRKSIRRVVQLNFPIFGDAGLVQISLSQSDSEEFTENGAPLYRTSCAFECLAPTYIVETSGAISDATVTPTVFGDVVNG